MEANNARGNDSVLEKTAVDVRPLTAEELAILDQHIAFDRGNADKHRKRLQLQSEGRGVYLVAWSEDVPIGHALLKWEVPAEYPFASRLDRCAHVEDVFVHPDYRSTGVGSQILLHAERAAQDKRNTTIGLAVGVDNPRARSLYERTGYEDTGVGEFTDRWPYSDREGQQQWEEETCNYLVKRLSG